MSRWTGWALAIVVVPMVACANGDTGRPAAVTHAGLATTSPIPSAGPSASAPAGLDQAVATADAFLVAYASSLPDDTPDSLRSRLRPYDTHRLDAVLAQGAAGGIGASGVVAEPHAVGVAPDGRLVVTAQVTVDGATRYVELYLASTAGGWRVDEVAL